MQYEYLLTFAYFLTSYGFVWTIHSRFWVRWDTADNAARSDALGRAALGIAMIEIKDWLRPRIGGEGRPCSLGKSNSNILRKAKSLIATKGDRTRFGAFHGFGGRLH
jgi:hypothetical protein